MVGQPVPIPPPDHRQPAGLLAADRRGARQRRPELPALVANLPAAIDAAVQQFLAFNAAYYIQQIISSQIGFAQLFATTVGQGSPASLPGGPTLRRSFS